MQRTIYNANSSIGGPTKLAHKLKAGSVVDFVVGGVGINIAHDRFTLCNGRTDDATFTIPGGYNVKGNSFQISSYLIEQ